MEKTIHIEAQQMDAGSDQSEGHAKQIEVLRPYNYCITPSGDEEVMLINVRLGSMSGQSCHQQSFESLGSLKNFLREDTEKLYNIRIYSICQAGSWEPLDVTGDMLSEIIAHEAIPEDFLEVARSHTSRSQPSEEAYCGSWFSNTSSSREEVSYSFKYPELRGRPGSEPWTIRMTSVYSSIDHPSERSCWIVLHPMYQSRAESRLLDYLAPERKEQPKRSTHQPLVQHVLLVSTYLTAWRDYLLHYENELLTLSKPVMGTPFNNNIPVSANTLTRTRFVQERLLPLMPIFRSYEETFTGLSKLNDDLFDRKSISLESHTEIKCTLRNMARQIAAYKHNVEFLLQKINTMAQLLSDMLALKNQHIAQDQNSQLTKMTQLTVQDSATLRVIGVATLVFLPTTFVATLFGTQLFYLTPSNSLQVSPQIWILFAISVPFTLLTMAWWLIRKRQHQIKRKTFWGDEEKGK